MTTSAIGYVAAVVLAAVFAVAGVAKLRHPSGTIRDFEGLGLPRARVLAMFVPIVELSVTALLLIVPAAGALGALVTLAFFTTFLVGRLRAGVHAPCACFGSARRDPLSGVEIARNVGLMVLAVVALATDRPVRPTALDVVVVVGPVLVTTVVLGMVRRRRRARIVTPGPTTGPPPGGGATSR